MFLKTEKVRVKLSGFTGWVTEVDPTKVSKYRVDFGGYSRLFSEDELESVDERVTHTSDTSHLIPDDVVRVRPQGERTTIRSAWHSHGRWEYTLVGYPTDRYFLDEDLWFIERPSLAPQTIDLTPTEAGYIASKHIFEEQIKKSELTIADAEFWLNATDVEDSPENAALVEQAMEALIEREQKRIKHMEEGIKLAQEGADRAHLFHYDPTAEFANNH